MPRIFKNFHLPFFKINCFPTYLSSSFTLKHDDNHSIYPHHNIPTNNNKIKNNINQAAIVLKCYNTIYDDLCSPTATTTTTTTTTTFSSFSTSDATSSTDDYYEPHTDETFAVEIESSSTASSTTSYKKRIASGGVPVKKYSSDPYADFRRSMLEMIEARENEVVCDVGDANDWEFFQELLLSYLTLNPKRTHKLIIRAFSDVVVSFMSDCRKSFGSFY